MGDCLEAGQASRTPSLAAGGVAALQGCARRAAAHILARTETCVCVAWHDELHTLPSTFPPRSSPYTINFRPLDAQPPAFTMELPNP